MFSNYPYLEYVFTVLKVFEPLEFGCIMRESDLNPFYLISDSRENIAFGIHSVK